MMGSKKHLLPEPLKINLLFSFETSEDTDRAAQRHGPADPVPSAYQGSSRIARKLIQEMFQFFAQNYRKFV